MGKFRKSIVKNSRKSTQNLTKILLSFYPDILIQINSLFFAIFPGLRYDGKNNLIFVIMQAIFLLFRILLQVRYRITLSGIEHLKTDAPIVVFPNHPALIDPIILSAFIGKYKILSPVVTETYFHTPGLESLLKQV